MKLRHFFIPHSETHRPAYLISKTAILLYIFLFLTFNLSVSIVARVKPLVLGLSANLSQQELIALTNAERVKSGLSALKENPKLNVAAFQKGQNMFSEQYWAHFAPSGKSPWDFITGNGYKFSYAGENLARNFYSNKEAVSAWMASPTHRDNILNPHYQDIGISIVEGTLNGQPTVLIVQEFGTPVQYLADNSPFNSSPKPVATPGFGGETKAKEEPSSIPTQIPVVVTKTEPLANSPVNIRTTVAGEKSYAIDPYLFLKNMGVSLFILLAFLILLDLYIIRRRAVVRLTSNHWPHLALIALGASTLINLGRGSII